MAEGKTPVDRSILARFPASITNEELEGEGWALDDSQAPSTTIRKTGTAYSWGVHRVGHAHLDAATAIAMLDAILAEVKGRGRRDGRLNL